MVDPVFRGGTVPPTPAARQQALLGWVTGNLSGSEVIREAVGSTKGLDVSLVYHPPGSSSQVLVSSVGRLSGDLLTTSKAIPGAPSWSVKVTGSAGADPIYQGIGVGVLGLFVSALVFLFLMHLLRSREFAMRLVDQRTGELRYQALHDVLTGLPNRALLFDRAQQMLARTRRRPSAVSALYIDLDDFKDINDTFSHRVGDHLLRSVAERLGTALRERHVGRLGGDEYRRARGRRRFRRRPRTGRRTYPRGACPTLRAVLPRTRPGHRACQHRRGSRRRVTPPKT